MGARHSRVAAEPAQLRTYPSTQLGLPAVSEVPFALEEATTDTPDYKFGENVITRAKVVGVERGPVLHLAVLCPVWRRGADDWATRVPHMEIRKLYAILKGVRGYATPVHSVRTTKYLNSAIVGKIVTVCIRDGVAQGHVVVTVWPYGSGETLSEILLRKNMVEVWEGRLPSVLLP